MGLPLRQRRHAGARGAHHGAAHGLHQHAGVRDAQVRRGYQPDHSQSLRGPGQQAGLDTHHGPAVLAHRHANRGQRPAPNRVHAHSGHADHALLRCAGPRDRRARSPGESHRHPLRSPHRPGDGHHQRAGAGHDDAVLPARRHERRPAQVPDRADRQKDLLQLRRLRPGHAPLGRRAVSRKAGIQRIRRPGRPDHLPRRHAVERPELAGQPRPGRCHPLVLRRSHRLADEQDRRRRAIGEIRLLSQSLPQDAGVGARAGQHEPLQRQRRPGAH